MTQDSRDGGRVPDGGRPTPGVPDVPEDDTDPEDEAESEDDGTDGSTQSEPERTASGRAMPGVPLTGGSAPAGEATSTGSEGHAEGGSCGSGEHHDHEPEHDLTTAISLRALKRTQTPGAVVADANTWSDWVGVVGEASGPELNAFFRNNAVDVDFFNDVSDGPAERLAAIDEGHHFHSERQVLVGLPEEARWAEAAGWEFQEFEAVAEEAGWKLEEE